jgi:hypothetical protein
MAARGLEFEDPRAARRNRDDWDKAIDEAIEEGRPRG